jgi:hypothetical protein
MRPHCTHNEKIECENAPDEAGKQIGDEPRLQGGPLFRIGKHRDSDTQFSDGQNAQDSFCSSADVTQRR